MQHTHKELPAICVQQTVPTANLARTGTGTVCIDTKYNDLQQGDMHVWSSGTGEPEGQNRVGGMSVHTSPLAGLLHVSNKVPYLHTSRGLCGGTVCNKKYATGGKGVMEVTIHVYCALCAVMHGLGWRVRPQTAPAVTAGRQPC